MKIILKYLFPLLLFSAASHPCIAQTDTLTQYLDFYEKPCDKVYAYLYRMIIKIDGAWLVKDFYLKEGTLKMKGCYSDDSLKTREGRFLNYYPNAQLQEDVFYNNGKKVGLKRAYSPNGELTDSSFFCYDIPCRFGYQWEKGHLIFKGIYDSKGTGIGEEWEFNQDTILTAYGKYSKGYQKDSIWTYRRDDGTLSCEESYFEGFLRETRCFDINGNIQPGSCESEAMPKTFLDLDKYLLGNLHYDPQDVLDFTARVVYTFVIDEHGNITDIQIVQKAFPGLDRAVVRQLETLPRCQPGYRHNHPYKFRITKSFTYIQN